MPRPPSVLPFPISAAAVLALAVLTGGLAASPLPAGPSDWANVQAGYGTLTTAAGAGLLDNVGASTAVNEWRSTYEGGLARSAELSNPHVAGQDALGNLYIADKEGDAIRMARPDGTIVTVAGNTGTASSGTGGTQLGPGTSATDKTIVKPNGLFVFPDGTIYFMETERVVSGSRKNRIIKRTPAGVFTVVVSDATTTDGGRGLLVSPDQQTIYFCDTDQVRRWRASSGNISTLPNPPGGAFKELGYLAFDPAGLVVATDRGTLVTPATGDDYRTGSRVWRYNGTAWTAIAGNGAAGTPDIIEATSALNVPLDGARGIAFLPNGGYFLATHEGGDILHVDTAGTMRTFIRGRGEKNLWLGEGQEPPLVATEYLSEPRSIVIAPNWDLLITCDDTGYVRRVKNVCPVPKIEMISCTCTAAQCRFTWASQSGRPYIVEKSTDLAVWQVLGVRTAAGASTEYVDSLASGLPHAFYRVSPPR